MEITLITMTLHPEKFEYENVRGAYFVKLIIGKFCAIAMGTSIIL